LTAVLDAVDYANNLEYNGYVIKVIDKGDFGSGQIYGLGLKEKRIKG